MAENGQKDMECVYKEDKLDGNYANGQKIEECMYKDGKKEGKYESWYENCQNGRNVCIKMVS